MYVISMSTKIYNVYKVVGKDFFFVYDLLQQISKEHTIETKNFFVDLIKRKKDSNEKLDFQLLKQLISDGNFNSSIVLYSYNNNIFLHFFNSTKVFLEELPVIKLNISNGILIDYHYQDQTDAWYVNNDSIDESLYDYYETEFQQRKILWDNIFGENGIPSKIGLIKELNPTYHDIELIKLLK